MINGELSLDLIFSPFYNFLYFFVTILFHLSTVFALLMTYKIKPNIKTINYSIFVVATVYIISLIFTPYISNINFISHPFDFIPFIIPYYIYLWPLLAFIVLILPTQGIQYLLYRWSIRKKSK